MLRAVALVRLAAGVSREDSGKDFQYSTFDWRDAFARELVHEQVPKTWLHRLQRRLRMDSSLLSDRAQNRQLAPARRRARMILVSRASGDYGLSTTRQAAP